MNLTEMEAKASAADCVFTLWLTASGPGSHQRRSMGRVGYPDAGDRKRNAQLVGTISSCLKATNSSSQQLNEIMPMIYKRFTDKTAEEWRQIYKVCLRIPYI